ncbi:hypothetical protein GCM10022221_67600 [Actinocorallia aurea]
MCGVLRALTPAEPRPDRPGYVAYRHLVTFDHEYCFKDYRSIDGPAIGEVVEEYVESGGEPFAPGTLLLVHDNVCDECEDFHHHDEAVVDERFVLGEDGTWRDPGISYLWVMNEPGPVRERARVSLDLAKAPGGSLSFDLDDRWAEFSPLERKQHLADLVEQFAAQCLTVTVLAPEAAPHE